MNTGMKNPTGYRQRKVSRRSCETARLCAAFFSMSSKKMMTARLSKTQTNRALRNYSLLHRCNMTDGDFANGLTLDRRLNLYCTTSGDGKYGYAVVFEIARKHYNFL